MIFSLSVMQCQFRTVCTGPYFLVAIAMLKYAKKVLPTNFLKMIYLGLIEPQFRYCCSVWGLVGGHYSPNPRQTAK